MTALAADQQAVALLEAMDPPGRELGCGLVLVTRQGLEDALCLFGELLVGGVAAGADGMLVPEEDETFYVGPVAEAEA